MQKLHLKPYTARLTAFCYHLHVFVTGWTEGKLLLEADCRAELARVQLSLSLLRQLEIASLIFAIMLSKMDARGQNVSSAPYRV